MEELQCQHPPTGKNFLLSIRTCANPTPEAVHQRLLSVEKSHSHFYREWEEKRSFQRQDLRAERATQIS